MWRTSMKRHASRSKTMLRTWGTKWSDVIYYFYWHLCAIADTKIIFQEKILGIQMLLTNSNPVDTRPGT